MSDALQPLRDRRPLAVQVYDQMYKAIHADSGSLKGEIPTETSLTELLGVSRATVRTALALLEEDGLLERGPGRRRHVVQPSEQGQSSIPSVEQLFITNQTARLDVLLREDVPATRWGASKLRVPRNTLLTMRSARITDGDLVICDSLELAPVDIAAQAQSEESSLLEGLGDAYVSGCEYDSIQIGPYSNQTRDGVPVDPSAPRVVITLVLKHEGRPVYLAKHVVLLGRAPFALLNPNS